MTASAGPALLRLQREYGDRVAFVTLYVREAHPGDRYPQPDDPERKMAHARAYEARDGITWPVAVDDVDGRLHRTLDPKPNASYFVDRNGDVAFRVLWSNDERALRAGLEAVLAGSRGEKQTRLVPMLTGLGKVDEILDLSGEQARRDVRREAPPLLAMARVAAFFRPLSPFGRGVAALATIMGSGIAAALAIRFALRRT